MPRVRPSARQFLGDRRAVSAVEFALIVPFFLVLMAAGLQLTAYLIAIRKVDLIANSISEILSQTMPPQNSTVATVSSADLHFNFDASMVLFPYMLADSYRRNRPWYENITIDFSSITFTPKNATCAGNGDPSDCYTAKVIWTTTGTAGNNQRPCGVPQLPAADDAAPTPQTLPRSVFGPGSVIAVDVVFPFAPAVGGGFIDPIRIARSVFLQPRYASRVDYDTTNDDRIAAKCAA